MTASVAERTMRPVDDPEELSAQMGSGLTGCADPMTWFKDLSPCTYLHRHCGVSIGWLDPQQPFSIGEVPAKFLSRLAVLHRDHQSLQTRGFHSCPFCTIADAAAHPHRSSAEIAVRAPDGTVYRAPALILHYITTHRYRPPEQFIRAVLEGEPLKIT